MKQIMHPLVDDHPALEMSELIIPLNIALFLIHTERISVNVNAFLGNFYPGRDLITLFLPGVLQSMLLEYINKNYSYSSQLHVEKDCRWKIPLYLLKIFFSEFQKLFPELDRHNTIFPK